MIYLRDIVEYCKAAALAGRLSANEADNWRYFCREYSKTFHTPLHVVMGLPAEHVILAVFEEQLEKKNLSVQEDFDSVVEELRRLEDPDYDKNVEKEMDDFVSNIEAFEQDRLERGAPIPRPKKQVEVKKEEGLDPNDPTKGDKEPEAPKQGFVDLSRFSQDEES